MEICTFMTPKKVFKNCDFNYIWVPLGMAKPLGIWQEGACQILAVEDALGPELLPFVCLMSGFIFLILDILKYMGVYKGI